LRNGKISQNLPLVFPMGDCLNLDLLDKSIFMIEFPENFSFIPAISILHILSLHSVLLKINSL